MKNTMVMRSQQEAHTKLKAKFEAHVAAHAHEVKKTRDEQAQTAQKQNEDSDRLFTKTGRIEDTVSKQGEDINKVKSQVNTMAQNTSQFASVNDLRAVQATQERHESAIGHMVMFFDELCPLFASMKDRFNNVGSSFQESRNVMGSPTRSVGQASNQISNSAESELFMHENNGRQDVRMQPATRTLQYHENAILGKRRPDRSGLANPTNQDSAGKPNLENSICWCSKNELCDCNQKQIEIIAQSINFSNICPHKRSQGMTRDQADSLIKDSTEVLDSFSGKNCNFKTLLKKLNKRLNYSYDVMIGKEPIFFCGTKHEKSLQFKIGEINFVIRQLQ